MLSVADVPGGSQSAGPVVINVLGTALYLPGRRWYCIYVTWGSLMGCCFAQWSQGTPKALLEGLLLCTVWQLGLCSFIWAVLIQLVADCLMHCWNISLGTVLLSIACGSEQLSAGASHQNCCRLHVAHLLDCKCWSYNQAGCSWAVTSVTQ
jgi:hypothetical protein